MGTCYVEEVIIIEVAAIVEVFTIEAELCFET